MDPITGISNAVAKIFEFLCTPAGQKLVEKSMERSDEARKNLQEFGNWLEKLFTGKLIDRG